MAAGSNHMDWSGSKSCAAASVLYGQVGPGGVINNVSKKPLFSGFGEVRAQYGSFDRKELAADFSGPIDAAGTLAFRLTGLLRDAGTEVDFTNDDRGFIAPALTWRPGDLR
jgi:iron complex outermembrane recepter protein